MADCLTQQVQTGAPSNSGTNGVSFSNPHITQVRVPRRDDGKWMSIASMIGTLIGRWVNKKLIDKAEDVEDKWREYTDLIGDTGKQEFTARAQLIKQCNDDLWAKYCQYALCGYKPDYGGILIRVRADAALASASARAQVCRTASRYNVGVNSDVMCNLLRTEMLATVGAAAQARENERQMMWKFNSEYVASAAVRFEGTYQGRLKLGADLLASAGQNYAFLAESLRRTAEKSIGDFATFAGLAAAIVLLYLNKGCPADSDCGCSGSEDDAPKKDEGGDEGGDGGGGP